MNRHAKELVRTMARLEVPQDPKVAARELTTRELIEILRERLHQQVRTELRNRINRIRIVAGRVRRLVKK